jgi:hypothetical protein
VAAKNDVTGDALRTKAPNDKYAEGWDRIFGKKEVNTDTTFWTHKCKHGAEVSVSKGKYCDRCGEKEDGTFE